MDIEEDISMLIDAVVRRAERKKAQNIQHIRNQVEQYPSFNYVGKARSILKLIEYSQPDTIHIPDGSIAGTLDKWGELSRVKVYT